MTIATIYYEVHHADGDVARFSADDFEAAVTHVSELSCEHGEAELVRFCGAMIAQRVYVDGSYSHTDGEWA